jgi:quinol monooxygenase YgiN
VSDGRRRGRTRSQEDRDISSTGAIALMRGVSVLIAIVDITVAAAHRAAALAQLDGEGADIRALPGNVAFRVYASREDDGRVTVVHEWDDEAAFDGYLESAFFARSGQVLRPMLLEAPVSRRFRAELLATVA